MSIVTTLAACVLFASAPNAAYTPSGTYHYADRGSITWDPGTPPHVQAVFSHVLRVRRAHNEPRRPWIAVWCGCASFPKAHP